MSVKTFAQDLAAGCVTTHIVNGATFLHLRDRAGIAALSVAPGSVHCPESAALGHVRAVVAGFVQEGIEEGRRWQSVSPDALAAAREEGRRAGWEQAMFRLSGEAASLCDKIDRAEAVVDELRTRLDAIATVRAELVKAMPEGEK